MLFSNKKLSFFCLADGSSILHVEVPVSTVLEALKLRNSIWKSKAQELAKKLNEKDQALESLCETISELEEKAEMNEAKLATETGKKAAAVRRAEKLYGDLHDLKKYVSVLEEKAKSNESKLVVSELEEALTRNEIKLLELELKVTALDSLLRALKSRVDNLEQECNKKVIIIPQGDPYFVCSFLYWMEKLCLDM